MIEDFIQYEQELTPTSQRKKDLKAIHSMVYELAGDWNKPRSGEITLTTSRGEACVFRTCNVAKRLNTILTELLTGNPSSKQLLKILDSRHNLSIEDLRKLHIKISWELSSVESAQRFQIKDICSSIPKGGGVYVLVFPNGKKFLGRSKNVREQVRAQFYKLFKFTPCGAWHKQAMSENNIQEPYEIAVRYRIGKGIETQFERVRKEMSEDTFYGS